MKALLVFPRYTRTLIEPVPPLGVGYLAAVLERAGVDVKVFDLSAKDMSDDELAAAMRHFDPQLIGISTITQQFPHAAAASRVARAACPRALVVMGGVHPSFTDEETLAACPEVDAVVRGETEGMALDLAAAAAGERELASVPSVSYRGPGGEVRRTPSPEPPQDLDALPFPARHLFPMDRYQARTSYGSVCTARGCPGRCLFCVSWVFMGSRYRTRSIDNVMDEVESELLGRYGYRSMYIVDDTFTLSRERTLEFCSALVRRGLGMEWACNTRADCLDDELLDAMRESGCKKLMLGLESTHESTLKLLRKNITAEQVRRATEMCHRHGIVVNLAFMLGLPGETPQMMKESIDFVASINLGPRQEITPLSPYPGSELFERAAEFGMRLVVKDWGEYDHAIFPAVETRECPRQEMIGVWTHIARRLVAPSEQLRVRGVDADETGAD